MNALLDFFRYWWRTRHDSEQTRLERIARNDERIALIQSRAAERLRIRAGWEAGNLSFDEAWRLNRLVGPDAVPAEHEDINALVESGLLEGHYINGQ